MSSSLLLSEGGFILTALCGATGFVAFATFCVGAALGLPRFSSVELPLELLLELLGLLLQLLGLVLQRLLVQLVLLIPLVLLSVQVLM